MRQNSWSKACLALGIGALAGAAVLAMPGADATQGQPVIAGQINGEEDVTVLTTNGVGATAFSAVGGDGGVAGEAESPGGTGVFGLGAATGVWGGGGADGGTGVYGYVGFPTGIGVHGKTTGSGSGVFGEASDLGVGVNGQSAKGVGVEAQSSNGTARQVVGKTTFSRSGVVTVMAGTASKTVQLGRVTAASMVLATAQQTTAVFVKAAVPGAGKFTIQLSGNAPTGGLKVAYFVLN